MKQTIRLTESELRRMISESVEDAWEEIKFGNHDTEDDWEGVKPNDEYEDIKPSYITHKPHKMYKLTESRINRIVKECVRRALNEDDGSYRGIYISHHPLSPEKLQRKIDACYEKGWTREEIQDVLDADARDW